MIEGKTVPSDSKIRQQQTLDQLLKMVKWWRGHASADGDVKQ
jgi:hypothetical protein